MPTLKIVTWNVNSLRVRMPYLLEWLDEHKPDIIGLQELKMQHEDFPVDLFKDKGYESAWYGQKTFNGVAILSKYHILRQYNGLPAFNDEQRRAISIETEYGCFINLYCPNGKERGTPSFSYKMLWYKHLILYLKEINNYGNRCVVFGDFNIAPDEIDIYDHTLFENRILCTSEEKECFKSVLDAGFIDIFRKLHPTEEQYSWWDYRGGSFRQNKGARIDHILIDTKHESDAVSCSVDLKLRKEERPSDHAPVVAEIKA
ncbi:exodeoxyribonuclease III [Candidatus Ichthyocystis sparus]|uniref:exodeoxyribonuclease III n=1 Tax=Candidatus Ichthyocystis sparus TaxID=1561004 RepID=UPI000A41CAC1|nr:exodeoxyribonuclease III [Candidatus Ichthyocystis sparus]